MSPCRSVSSTQGRLWPFVRLFPFLLMAMVFILYVPTLHYEFLDWDDYMNITQHARFIRFNRSDLLWLMRDSPLGDYKPAVWLSYGLDRWIWGFRPEGYRLTNILLHCANAWLVYLLGIRLAGRLGIDAVRSWGPSAMVAALFAFHPQRVESVVWISERKDVLYAFFYLAATWVYLGIPEHRRSLWRLAFVYILGALSLLSKPAAVMLPVTLLLFVFLPEPALSGKQESFVRRVIMRIIELAPLFLCALWIGLRAVQDHSPDGVAGARVDQDPSMALMIIRSPWVYGQALVFSITRTFFPVQLSPFNPGWTNPDMIEKAMLLILGVLFAGAGFILWRKGFRLPVLCAGWFVLTIFPSLPIRYPADRYSYVPAIGLLALPVIAWWMCYGRIRQRTVRLLILMFGVLMLGASALATLNYFPVWKDSLSLWERAVQYGSEPKAFEGLAVAQMRASRLDEAEQTVKKALAMSSHYPRAQSVLGEVLLRQGRTEEAIVALETAISQWGNMAVAWMNLGVAHAMEGRLDDAVRCWQRVLELNPLSLTAAMNMGRAMALQGHMDAARDYYLRALEIQPGSEAARSALETLDTHPSS